MINYLIIGAQGSGTNVFHEYLLQHPQVMPALKPEINYFDHYYSRGIEWYSQQFPLISGYAPSKRPKGHITGEACSRYLHHPRAAERVKLTCPDVKMIILLRNPTDRAYTHFRHAVKIGKENLPFGLALKSEAKRLERGNFLLRDNPYHHSESNLYNSYITWGLYADQLKHWLSRFDRDQFLILRSEDFFKNPLQHAAKAYKFLDLPDHAPMPVTTSEEQPFEYLSGHTRAKVERVFERSNEELCHLLNWEFAW